MADLLVQEIQESNSSDSVESETLKILEASQKIQQNLESDTVRNAYEEVRLATIGALQELRLSTNHDLQSFKDELANPSSNLSEGVISQEELTMIQKEFQELEQQALIEQSERLKQQVVNQFQEMFGASPEVMSFLEAQLSENSELISQESFASELLVLIAKYNRSQDEVYISPPSREDISTFYEGIQNSVSLQSNIDTVILIERFQQASTRNKELNTQMQNYRRELRDAQTEEEITRLRDIIQELETKQAYNSMQVSETAESIEGITVTSDENQVDAIKEDALVEANFELMKGKKLLQESFESLANPDGASGGEIYDLFSNIYNQTSGIQGMSEDVSDFIYQLLEDIKNPDSFISQKFANLPLPTEIESDIYTVVLAAKTQEYQIELAEKLDSVELLEMREDMKQTLALRFDINGISDEQLGSIFDAILQKISENPGKIESMASFQEILDEKNIDASEIGVVALTIMQELVDAYNEKLAAEKLALLNTEIITLAQENPRNQERITIVLAVMAETGKNIDKLRENQAYVDAINQLGQESLEYKLLSGEITQESYEEQKVQILAILATDISQTEMNGETLPRGDTGTVGNEESPESVEAEIVATAQAVLDAPTNSEEQIIAIETASNTVDTFQGETSINAGGKILEVVGNIDSPEAQALAEKITTNIATELVNPNLATSSYAQDQVNTLRTTLGNDNPLVARITTAQEEGLQKAYKNETDPSKPLPKPLEDFYSETIHAIGLTDPKEIQTLTPEELKLMRNNEKVQDGFKSFTQTLSACNLREDIFPLRHEILGVLQNEYGIAFQLNDDYLNSNEMQKLLAHIVYACKDGLPPSYTQQIQKSIFNKPLEDTTNFIKGLNTPKIAGGGLGVGAFDPAKSGLGSVFRKMFYDVNNTVAPFKREKFREALKI